MKENFVLITIDSLRADAINKTSTPHLCKIVDKYGGQILKKVYTAGMPTYYSFPAILGSIYPLSFGFRIGVPKKVPLISEVLSENGFETYGFSAGNMYTSSFAGYNRGFNHFYDYKKTSNGPSSRIKHFLKSKKSLYKISRKVNNLVHRINKRYKIAFLNYYPVPNASTIFNDTLAITDKTSEPFFIWNHLMDVHEPYLVKKNSLNFSERLYRSNFESKRSRIWSSLIRLLHKTETLNPQKRIHLFVQEMNKIKKSKSFLNKIYYKSLEEMEKELVAYIETIMNKYPNTNIIITSDHGEEFFDNETYGHFPLFHNESVNRIPLVLMGKSFTKTIKPELLVSTLDIAPTICSLMNIDSPPIWQGKSLYSLSELQERVIYTESIFGHVPKSVVGTADHPKPLPLITAYSQNKKPATIIGKDFFRPEGSYQDVQMLREALIRQKHITSRTILKRKIGNIKETDL